MVNSRQKGKLGESLVKNLLDSSTEYTFEYTPGSGNGKIKGDLYIPKVKNRFCIEIKNYKESPISDKILTNKSNVFVGWWNKLLQDCKFNNQEPLLFFKYNRSKLFVTTSIKPTLVNNFLDINQLGCYIMLSDEWIVREKIEWLKT